jgi:exonuclease SbcC
MRPREVTLEGFRSYRERVTFDLRDRRLLGIVGPIGAGKSTILDAIVFALYGKTPSFERDTRSLINQLADGCHVELVFEVDGQIWRAQRALRRRGQSQHRLERLAKDAGDAEVLEHVLQERPMRARVEGLLGMGFDAFCRSVLLAQNRFAEFLKATPTDRNAVLKGVFGYERFDAALSAAKDHVRSADVELESLAREGARLAEARDRLTDARAEATATSDRHAALDAARERLDELTASRDAAARLADEAATRFDRLQAIATRLPAVEDLDVVGDRAAAAAQAVGAAQDAVATGDDARAAAEAELRAIEERSGGRSAFEAFAELVTTHDHEAKAVERAIAAARSAATDATAARAAVDGTVAKRTSAETALAAAADGLTAAEAARAEAEATLHDAQHAEMAYELRRELTPGEPCPVCAQVIERAPRAGAAPKVAAADRALTKARTAEARARQTRDAAATAVATVVEQAAAAALRADELAAAQAAADDALRDAEAALTVTKSELVDRLGDGDPRAPGSTPPGGKPTPRTPGSGRSRTSSRPRGARSASPARSAPVPTTSAPLMSSSGRRSSNVSARRTSSATGRPRTPTRRPRLGPPSSRLSASGRRRTSRAWWPTPRRPPRRRPPASPRSSRPSPRAPTSRRACSRRRPRATSRAGSRATCNPRASSPTSWKRNGRRSPTSAACISRSSRTGPTGSVTTTPSTSST